MLSTVMYLLYVLNAIARSQVLSFSDTHNQPWNLGSSTETAFPLLPPRHSHLSHSSLSHLPTSTTSAIWGTRSISPSHSFSIKFAYPMFPIYPAI
ncbi:uncharacterized protein F4807DRAFT_300553 [Annulohypoxylon truncatum]|uniref:uncharacterized protein n=1 Tax=Annulohypoxylon truncatum TaxID=327061 RepID=UPI0020074B89|nr:uncharacterized protein F4807DRAFT_300553 [Annulohypoxylon truncatum]KAI1204928.1 hypothetical protein F4807DRAFT_300553 [Annulohypoxylon truncatum]